MNNRLLVTLLGITSLILMLVALPFLSSCTAQPAEAVVLEWVSFEPETQSTIQNVKRGFIDRVNEMGGGDFVLQYRGGPETIAAFDQGKAVQSGVIDMAITPVGFYESLAPGINAIKLSRITVDEERKSGGGYDYVDELHNAAGLKWIGRATMTEEGFFYVALREQKLETREDFQGFAMGGGTGGRAAALGWGSDYTDVVMPDFYASMERGLVDGLAVIALSSQVAQGVHEVTDYYIDHKFYQSTAGIYMNLDTWNGLPKNMQEILIEAITLSEKDQIVWFNETDAALRQKAMDGGVEFYKLAPDVAEWYLATAYDAAWAYQMDKFPDETPGLKALISK